LKTKKPLRNNAFIKYSALGSQMIGTLLIAAWGGRQLDSWLQTQKPYMTAVCMLVGMLALVIGLVKNLQKNSKDES
jgi:ATP synthase protein I